MSLCFGLRFWLQLWLAWSCATAIKQPRLTVKTRWCQAIPSPIVQCVMSWCFIPASLQACWLLMVDDLVQCLSLSDTKHVSDVAGHLSITLVAAEHPSHIQGGLHILQLVRSVSQRFPYFGELFVKVLVLPAKLPLFIGIVMFVRHGI